MKGLHIHYNCSGLSLERSLLTQLKNYDFNYAIIHNFFDQSEIESIKKSLNKIDGSIFYRAALGYFVYPRTAFNTAVLNENPELYFKSTKTDMANLLDKFDIPLDEKFSTVFSFLNHNVACNILSGAYESKFNSFNFRIMTEECGTGGTSNIHNGSTITERCWEGPYKHLQDEIDFDNQLSFFSMIQNADEGGEITLYNYKRKDYSNLKEGHYINDDFSEVDLLETKNKISLRMSPGDLLVFPGGQTWHRVEPILKGNRITLGGILGTDFDDKSWFYWI